MSKLKYFLCVMALLEGYQGHAVHVRTESVRDAEESALKKLYFNSSGAKGAGFNALSDLNAIFKQSRISPQNPLTVSIYASTLNLDDKTKVSNVEKSFITDLKRRISDGSILVRDIDMEIDNNSLDSQTFLDVLGDICQKNASCNITATMKPTVSGAAEDDHLVYEHIVDAIAKNTSYEGNVTFKGFKLANPTMCERNASGPGYSVSPSLKLYGSSVKFIDLDYSEQSTEIIGALNPNGGYGGQNGLASMWWDIKDTNNPNHAANRMPDLLMMEWKNGDYINKDNWSIGVDVKKDHFEVLGNLSTLFGASFTVNVAQSGEHSHTFPSTSVVTDSQGDHQHIFTGDAVTGTISEIPAFTPTFTGSATGGGISEAPAYTPIFTGDAVTGTISEIPAFTPTFTGSTIGGTISAAGEHTHEFTTAPSGSLNYVFGENIAQETVNLIEKSCILTSATTHTHTLTGVNVTGAIGEIPAYTPTFTGDAVTGTISEIPAHTHTMTEGSLTGTIGAIPAHTPAFTGDEATGTIDTNGAHTHSINLSAITLNNAGHHTHTTTTTVDTSNIPLTSPTLFLSSDGHSIPSLFTKPDPSRTQYSINVLNGHVGGNITYKYDPATGKGTLSFPPSVDVVAPRSKKFERWF